MLKPAIGMLLVLLFTQVCTAQNTKVSPSIYDTGSGDNPGNVGVGTTAPAAKLEVTGGIRATGGPNPTAPSSGTGVEIGWDGTQGVVQVYDRTNGAGKPLWLNYGIGNTILGGNVGIGTTTTGERLVVHDPNGYTKVVASTGGPGNDYKGFFGATSGTIKWGIGDWGSGDDSQMVFYSGGIVERMRVTNGGNVGIGTTNPGAKLEVNGNVRVSGAGSSITFADGTMQSTAWTGVLCGGDYAESVDVTGAKEHYELGDVMVVDPKNDSFTRSAEPYSTEVSGVYSTKPGVLGRKSIDSEKTRAEVPMAMVGIVPTKVSAENGPIRRGDLLVTSSTPGHAMKGTDRSRMLGAVVGKALGSLDSGTGMIDILVTLQ